MLLSPWPLAFPYRFGRTSTSAPPPATVTASCRRQSLQIPTLWRSCLMVSLVSVPLRSLSVLFQASTSPAGKEPWPAIRIKARGERRARLIFGHLGTTQAPTSLPRMMLAPSWPPTTPVTLHGSVSAARSFRSGGLWHSEELVLTRSRSTHQRNSDMHCSRYVCLRAILAGIMRNG